MQPDGAFGVYDKRHLFSLANEHKTYAAGKSKIIFEIKAIQSLSSSEIKQTLNYLAASKNKLGLLVNFGEDSLKYKRIIL